MNRNWRVRSLLREASLNVANGGTRTLLLAVVSAAVLTMGGWLEAQSVQQIIDRDVALARRGRFVLQITPGSNDRLPLSAQACERLAGQPGVVASGSVLENDLIGLRIPPGTTLRRIMVTPGLYDVFDLSPVQDNETRVQDNELTQIFAGHEAVAELGLATGAPLAFKSPQQSAAFTVGLVASNSVERYPLADRAIVIPTVGRETGACFVEIDPTIFDEYRFGGVAALDTLTEGKPTISPLVNVEPGETPSERYADRISRLSGFVTGLVLIALFTVDLQTRRKEIGIYRATGTTRLAAFLLFYTEHLLMLAGGCVMSVFAASVLLTPSGFGQQAALHWLAAMYVAVPIASIGLALIITVAVSRRDIISTLKQ